MPRFSLLPQRRRLLWTPCKDGLLKHLITLLKMVSSFEHRARLTMYIAMLTNFVQPEYQSTNSGVHAVECFLPL